MCNFLWVRRQWNDYRKAKYRLSDIHDVHWDTISGGVAAKSPQSFLHCYVRCNGMLEGELAHSGSHGPCPHSIKVCVTKTGNDSEVYKQLADRAGPKPVRQIYRTAPDADTIIHALVNNEEHPAILRKKDLLVINPRNIPELVRASGWTADSRSKRLRKRIIKHMAAYSEFKQAKYGNMLAYRICKEHGG